MNILYLHPTAGNGVAGKFSGRTSCMTRVAAGSIVNMSGLSGGFAQDDHMKTVTELLYIFLKILFAVAEILQATVLE